MGGTSNGGPPTGQFYAERRAFSTCKHIAVAVGKLDRLHGFAFGRKRHARFKRGLRRAVEDHRFGPVRDGDDDVARDAFGGEDGGTRQRGRPDRRTTDRRTTVRLADMLQV